MPVSSSLIAASAVLAVVACGSPKPVDAPPTAVVSAPHAGGTTFEDDVAFLGKHGEVDVLVSPGGGRVAVSARYQGRVMTSAVGAGARSLGFVHRAFIEGGKSGTAFDNYGGEDRFWLGPEGGQYGLYFPPGKPFAFREWQTPHEMQEGAWEVTKKTDAERAYTRRMHVTNWSGTPFVVDVARRVRLLDAAEVAALVGGAIPNDVEWVAFESENRITNVGDAAWTETTGLPSIWILGMFAPAKDAHIIVPFDATGAGPVVNDRYFGKVPADRLAVRDADGLLVMKADGEYRSKIGLGPSRARQLAASYSASAQLLTIVTYAEVPRGKKYVNSMWEKQSDPYGGDVINAYNDGPTEPGKPSLGGFFELETSSPAAALTPGQSLVHVHRTMHFVGSKEALGSITERVLGVSLDRLSL